MIADLKPYLEYKESGLPWLGQVPGHWECIPNRGLVRRRKALVGKRHSDYRLLSLTKQGVIVRDISTGKGKFSSDMGTSQEVRNGDLVFCLFDVPETPRTVGLSRHEGMITGAYTVFESLGRGSPEYFELFYRAMDDRKLLSPLYSGLRNTIPAERFLGTKTPQPPPAEQAVIVRFLDWANGRLERAIRAKRKVIALLNEQKLAIIHRAVTHGLDPSVPLKPSSIPWLGDISQHWEVRRLKSLVKEAVAGPFGSSLTKSMYTQFGYRVYGQQQVIPDDFSLGDYYISRAQFEEMRRYRVFSGDVLVSVIGTVGRVAVVPDSAEPGIINPRLVRYRPDATAVRSRWMQLVMQDRVAQAQISEASKGTTMDTLNMRSLGKLLLLIPPLAEQDAILEYISREREPFTSAISRLEREIELLREYRTRLVADVVTGKLDVRETAARLPEEATPDTAEDAADLSDETEPADEEATV